MDVRYMKCTGDPITEDEQLVVVRFIETNTRYYLRKLQILSLLNRVQSRHHCM